MEVKEKVYEVIKDFIEKEYQDRDVFFEKYNEIKNVRISDLGVDSVDFYNVVLNIEEMMDCNIDWNVLDPENFQTIEKIEKVLE